MNVRARRWTAHLCLLSAALLAGMLRLFPPASSAFYPQCPVFFWLHLYCPGCGGTRALAALLHGRLGEAWHWNAMVVTFLPALAAFFGLSYLRAITNHTFRWPTIPSRLLTIIFAAAACFTVARNLPL